jgi:hypothetical protein
LEADLECRGELRVSRHELLLLRAAAHQARGDILRDVLPPAIGDVLHNAAEELVNCLEKSRGSAAAEQFRDPLVRIDGTHFVHLGAPRHVHGVGANRQDLLFKRQDLSLDIQLLRFVAEYDELSWAGGLEILVDLFLSRVDLLHSRDHGVEVG